MVSLDIFSPSVITTHHYHSLTQITTLGGGGSTTIRGTLSKPGQVSVGLTGHGDKPARMIEGNRFETELPLQQGGNSISIAARDTSGNRSNYTYSVNVASQSPQSFAYDDDGNLTSDGVRAYEWDSQSRLTKITWTTGKTTQFKYNALGQRCERIETDGTTVTNSYYLFDGIQPIDRRTGTSANTATIDRRYFSQGEQRKNGTSWDSFYYCRDHLGSVREVVQANGTLAARYDFDPYGKRLTQFQSSTYAGGCDFGFTGHRTQPSPVVGQTELALTHFRAYDPQLGRWLSADPIAERGGINVYRYVNNSPSIYVDPKGEELAGALIGAAVGGVIGGVSTGTWQGAVGGLEGGLIGGLTFNPELGILAAGALSGALGSAAGDLVKQGLNNRNNCCKNGFDGREFAFATAGGLLAGGMFGGALGTASGTYGVPAADALSAGTQIAVDATAAIVGDAGGSIGDAVSRW